MLAGLAYTVNVKGRGEWRPSQPRGGRPCPPPRPPGGKVVGLT